MAAGGHCKTFPSAWHKLVVVLTCSYLVQGRAEPSQGAAAEHRIAVQARGPLGGLFLFAGTCLLPDCRDGGACRTRVLLLLLLLLLLPRCTAHVASCAKGGHGRFPALVLSSTAAPAAARSNNERFVLAHCHKCSAKCSHCPHHFIPLEAFAVVHSR